MADMSKDMKYRLVKVLMESIHNTLIGVDDDKMRVTGQVVDEYYAQENKQVIEEAVSKLASILDWNDGDSDIIKELVFYGYSLGFAHAMSVHDEANARVDELEKDLSSKSKSEDTKHTGKTLNSLEELLKHD